MGDSEAAGQELAELVRRSPETAEAHTGLAQFLRRCDRHDEAAAALAAAVERVGEHRDKLVKPLYDVLEHLGAGAAAAAQLRDLAERHLGDDDFLREVVSTLDQEGHAATPCPGRHVVDRAPAIQVRVAAGPPAR